MDANCPLGNRTKLVRKTTENNPYITRTNEMNKQCIVSDCNIYVDGKLLCPYHLQCKIIIDMNSKTSEGKEYFNRKILLSYY